MLPFAFDLGYGPLDPICGMCILNLGSLGHFLCSHLSPCFLFFLPGISSRSLVRIVFLKAPSFLCHLPYRTMDCGPVAMFFSCHAVRGLASDCTSSPLSNSNHSRMTKSPCSPRFLSLPPHRAILPCWFRRVVSSKSLPPLRDHTVRLNLSDALSQMDQDIAFIGLL